MTTELVVTTQPAIEPLIYTVTKETIENTIGNYLGLKINGIADKTGLAEVKAAKGLTVKARTTIEAERKAAKEPYKKAGEMIDARAKELTALLAPCEKHLTDEIVRIETEAAKAKEAQLNEQLKERIARLGEVGGAKDTSRVRLMTDGDFGLFLMQTAEDNRARKEQEERDRVAREEMERQRAELAAERKRIDEETLKLQNEQAAVNAERMRLENEERKRQRDEADRIEKEERDRQLLADEIRQRSEYEANRLKLEADIMQSRDAAFPAQVAPAFNDVPAAQPVATDSELIAYFVASCRIALPLLSTNHRQEELFRLLDLFANALREIPSGY